MQLPIRLILKALLVIGVESYRQQVLASIMGSSKCLGLILLLLFLSSAMAYLGSVAHGKRDVAQKVETTKKVYIWFNFKLILLILNSAQRCTIR